MDNITYTINNKVLEFKFLVPEITIFLSEGLREILHSEMEIDDIIFNFDNISYIDSSGINVLVIANKRIGKFCTIKNCSLEIIHLLDILNLKNKFNFVTGE